jgi:two-component system sensor histidine kinase/response regulator
MVTFSKNIVIFLLASAITTVAVLVSLYHDYAGILFLMGSCAGYLFAKVRKGESPPAATPPSSEYLPKKHLNHEVRTPLAAVVGTIGYLVENPDKDTIIESLETLTTSCLNLEAVVLDLLESSTEHDPKLFSHPAPTDISRLCSKLAHTIKDKGTEKGIRITASISPDIPYNGLIDRVRTYQLLHRVLASVLHQLENTPGELSLSFLCTEEEENNPLYNLIVTLNAPNTTPGKLLSPSAMSFISRLLKALGATITSTQTTTGALITIFIPFKKVLAEDKELYADSFTEVLIVSDAPDISEHISSCLRILGYSRYAVLDSDSFLSSSLQSFDPSLLITVLDSTARNFTSLIANSESYPNSKNIFVTDSLDDVTRKHFTQNRLSPPLLLPLGIGDLQQKLLRPKFEKARAVTAKSGLRVLVVDDVRLNRIVLAKHLESAGHEVITACNGEEALDVLSRSGHFLPSSSIDVEKLFDMVIMDIDMPVLGGLAATELIRSREQLLANTGCVRHVPIIAATADAIENDYDKFIMAGMEWFLTKPVDPNRLLQLVEHFGGIATRRQPNTGEPNQEIKLHWLYEQFSGDEEAVAEIIEAFIDEIDSLWLSLFRGAVNGTTEDIRAHAHALKGSLQNVGAHSAAEVARQVEAAAKAGKTSEARELIESLVSKIKLAKESAVKLHSERNAPKSGTILTV